MDYAAALELLTEAKQALAEHEISVGVEGQVGSAAEGSGAAALLWLANEHRHKAADVLAALEDSGLTAVPHTMDPAALGVVDWLQNAGAVEVRRAQAA